MSQAHPPAQPVPAPAPAADKLAAETKEARVIGSYGAQVILDYDGDAALGARGGAGSDVAENTMIRDVDLVKLGHNPIGPSNDLLGTRPNGMPGKGLPPKHKAPGIEALEAGTSTAAKA